MIVYRRWLASRYAALQLSLGFAVTLTGMVNAAEPLKLELHEKDHIAVIGNTLADRMQHDGWLESLIQARFPEKQLVYRDMGFSGDEVDLRIRSQDFGSPDKWLTHTKANVVFAFFGYNESYAGEAGLPAFEQKLAEFVRNTKSQKYDGEVSPQVVLFSPIAFEDLQSPNLPDGKATNQRLELYTNAIKKVAEKEGAAFVDLFRPSLALYAKEKAALTINGVHLTSRGNQLIAEQIVSQLFPKSTPKFVKSPADLEKLREAVLDKNFHWFNRYRTVDGFSIYGGRADLQFTDGQTNRVVMQREMEILDAMTANRDPRIWARAQGKDAEIKDETPEFIPVITNKPGTGPNGEHTFLGGEEAIKHMTVGEGFHVNLFASEEQFPELINPVQMAWDTRGRLWVAAWATYPHWKPKEQMNDRLLILEDTDGDGKADKCTNFAGDLHNPTGFEFWNGGVIVAMAPDILFLKDTNGDDKYDVKERIVSGIDSADTHHTASSFTLDPGGALYFQEGTFHHSQVETPHRAVQRVANGAVFRYDPRRQDTDIYTSYGFANPHGHVFDRWGQDIVHDGTGAVPYHGAVFSTHLNFPDKHGGAPTVYNQRTRPCPATEILSSRHFPDSMEGELLVGNVIGFQGILRYRVKDNGSSFGADELEPMLYSSDPNFRPVDLETGPDGALYFVDWQNPIIGHMQHNLRDPSRDRIHGRVYRVTYNDRPLVKPVPIAGRPIPELLELLKSDEGRVRYRAKIELSARDSSQVLTAVNAWIKKLDPKDANYEHHLLEALWLHQHHDKVEPKLLERLLGCSDFRARAAATRVLCYWSDRVPNSLDLLRKLAADEHPRVRLEAVRASSFLTSPEAIEVALIASELPTDQFIDYVVRETRRVLDPIWKKAIDAGQELKLTSDVGQKFFLGKLSTDQLLAKPRTLEVSQELLYRSSLQDNIRTEAIQDLANREKTSEFAVLLNALKSIDSGNVKADESVVYDLVRLLAARDSEQLRAQRAELVSLSQSAKTPIIRQSALLALIAVDRSTDQVWQQSSTSIQSLRDLIRAMPTISDASLRSTLYDRVGPLLQGLPKELAEKAGSKSGALGRYVRIELPRTGTLTLAEVEVYADGRNVARSGKASQINTSHGGDAARAIDGNTSPTYGDGGQTHTSENTENPWWEVDLGESLPVEKIVVFNRGEGNLSERLSGYTVKLLDEARAVIFEKTDNPTPKPSSEFAIEAGGSEGLIRRAAMEALASVRGREKETFAALSQFVVKNVDRLAAIRAIRKIPRQTWPAEQTNELLGAVYSYVGDLPTQQRTSPAALEVLEFGDTLAALLPAPDATKARKQLRELGVRVIRIGTLLERMSYDQDVIVLEAGKPVEFLFENADMMPHNLVIAQPGSLEEIGKAAEESALQPGAAQRQYVPSSDKILLASKLLQPQQRQQLSFIAPTQPGVYPMVCTYPGHWRRMFAAVYVVSDLDAYQAAPETYLTEQKIEAKDELLASRRPRTEWKLEDLASAVAEAKDPRSYGNGLQAFKVANCIACHKVGEIGTAIGPDLTKLDPKMEPADILKELLDPSARINEKFQTYQFLTDSDELVSGLILEETTDSFKIIENPLAKAEPRILAKSEIQSQRKSPVSIMPKGLLDQLTRDEILDLVAFVVARGDESNPAVQGKGGHEHHHDHDH